MTTQWKPNQKPSPNKDPRKKSSRWFWPLLALLVTGAVLLALSPILRLASKTKATLAAQAEPAAASTSAPRASAVAQREAEYQKSAASLTELARDESADAQARRDAGAALAALTERRALEADLVAALQAMGFAPCMALYQNDSLTLLLAAEALDAEQSAAILSLCLTHVPVRAENVRIVTGAELE